MIVSGTTWQDNTGTAIAAGALSTSTTEQIQKTQLAFVVLLMNRDEAMKLYSLAQGLLAHRPVLKDKLEAAFAWVDNFLHNTYG